MPYSDLSYSEGTYDDLPATSSAPAVVLSASPADDMNRLGIVAPVLMMGAIISSGGLVAAAHADEIRTVQPTLSFGAVFAGAPVMAVARADDVAQVSPSLSYGAVLAGTFVRSAPPADAITPQYASLTYGAVPSGFALMAAPRADDVAKASPSLSFGAVLAGTFVRSAPPADAITPQYASLTYGAVPSGFALMAAPRADEMQPAFPGLTYGAVTSGQSFVLRAFTPDMLNTVLSNLIFTTIKPRGRPKNIGGGRSGDYFGYFDPKTVANMRRAYREAWELGALDFSGHEVDFNTFALRSYEHIHGEESAESIKAKLDALATQDKPSVVVTAIKIGGITYLVWHLAKWLL
jgi:hypothetical protein